MKKPSTTTILLTAALTASVIGNALQYNTGKPAEPINQVENPAAQDELLPEVPADAASEITSWAVTATFAITYRVQEQAGTPGGATVTTYVKDAQPRTIKSKGKPTSTNVTWRPLPDNLPGLISQEVYSIEAHRPGQAKE